MTPSKRRLFNIQALINQTNLRIKEFFYAMECLADDQSAIARPLSPLPLEEQNRLSELQAPADEGRLSD